MGFLMLVGLLLVFGVVMAAAVHWFVKGNLIGFLMGWNLLELAGHVLAGIAALVNPD